MFGAETMWKRRDQEEYQLYRVDFNADQHLASHRMMQAEGPARCQCAWADTSAHAGTVA